MSSRLLDALCTGAQLGSLSRFTPDYLAARKALHKLLVFPDLDTISLGDDLDKTTNLFTLVASGNSRLSDLTNINVVMNYYREKYLQLQLDTLPVARDLATYATIQQILLPFVKRDDQADIMAGDIPPSIYLSTNTPLVSEYLESVKTLSERSTEVKNDWDNAINMKINECDQKIDKWQQSIDELTEEQKNMTMFACFAAFCAFLPAAGMLAALSVAGALGGTVVWQAIEVHKIIKAINELKAAVRNVKNTKAKLEALLTPMQEIAQSLSTARVIPAAMIQWEVVQINVQEYINTVSK
ncbi:hypothetical protein F5887DRAFT_1227143 [Amanita rubescens]|nr:hypothetical protein F5887DRAFT_1227143 [Amanita rubescens]